MMRMGMCQVPQNLLNGSCLFHLQIVRGMRVSSDNVRPIGDVWITGLSEIYTKRVPFKVMEAYIMRWGYTNVKLELLCIVRHRSM